MNSGESEPGRQDPSAYHEPVLLEEIINLLVTDTDGLYVDGTTGGGGHAERIHATLTDRGELLCLDADEEALEAAANRMAGSTGVSFRQANFRTMRAAVEQCSARRPAGILLDLGVSSHQIDDARRGFTFRDDAPLDMRFDRRQSLSAVEVVNSYDEHRIAEILFEYGEERAARRIARNIVERRPVNTTGSLAVAVEMAVGPKFLVKSLARVFQAIRIEVNDELNSLRKVLDDGTAILETGGRMAVISYHSLEDRIVKQMFRDFSATSVPSGTKLAPDIAIEPRTRLVTRHAVVPSESESRRNPRARSAKLRVAERVAVQR
jgi:16S rRNA (cytosine1402-N4)-methyltransferase